MSVGANHLLVGSWYCRNGADALLPLAMVLCSMCKLFD